MPHPTLLLLTGPVGGGKSTVALALAERLRMDDRRVAVIDLDLLYEMARQTPDYGDEAIWRVARRAAAALAESFWADGLDTVIVEGEFFCQAELDALTERLTTPAARHFFTLDVTYPQALAHVAGDPTRGASRDPVFLHWLHAQFTLALPWQRTVGPVLTVGARTPAELAESIARML
jgi:hypothetical protein